MKNSVSVKTISNLIFVCMFSFPIIGKSQQSRDDCMQEANRTALACLLQCNPTNSACAQRCTDRKFAQEDRCSRIAPQNQPITESIGFDGPGNLQDFIAARFQCYKETTMYSSQGSVDGYGGSASTTAQPSCAAFAQCIGARGYFRSPTGRLIVPPELVIRCKQD